MESRTDLNYIDIISNQLWDYLVTPMYRDCILEIVRIAIDIYDQPKQSWMTSPVYAYTRRRSAELLTFFEDLKKAETHAVFVSLFIGIFETGGWTSTSANVDIIRGLMVAVYGKAEEKNYLTEEAIHALGEQLVVRVHQPFTVKEQTAMVNANTVFSDKRREEIKNEMKALVKLNFAEKQTALLNFHLHKPTAVERKEPALPVNKLKVNYKDSRKLVKGLFGAKVQKKTTPADLIDIHVDTREARKNLENFFNKKLG